MVCLCVALPPFKNQIPWSCPMPESSSKCIIMVDGRQEEDTTAKHGRYMDCVVVVWHVLAPRSKHSAGVQPSFLPCASDVRNPAPYDLGRSSDVLVSFRR